MNDNSPIKPNGRMPSDTQLDNVLYEFFRLEMPVELNQPFHRPAVAPAAAIVTVVQGGEESTPGIPRNRKLVVVSTFAVLALTLLMLVQRQETPPSSSTPIANTVEEKVAPLSPPETLMDVSSPGDQAVGDDGVTLPETDSEIKIRH